MADYLGIDCGGTNLRAGIVSKDGELIESWKVSSPLKTNPQSFAEIIKATVDGAEFEAIGIGVPGPLDLEKGLILISSNLENKEPLEIVDQVKAIFKKDVSFDRDTIIALIGEAWVGSAIGAKNVVMLTLGTGVGGAAMINGEIERGADGKAGEIGHMIIDSESNKECGLGHKGCLEAMINGTEALDELATFLGLGLANIVDIFNPEKIIIGGGKLAMGDFLPQAIQVMKDNGVKPTVDEVIIEYAKLGEWSGVIGAAKLAIKL